MIKGFKKPTALIGLKIYNYHPKQTYIHLRAKNASLTKYLKQLA